MGRFGIRLNNTLEDQAGLLTSSASLAISMLFGMVGEMVPCQINPSLQQYDGDSFQRLEKPLAIPC